MIKRASAVLGLWMFANVGLAATVTLNRPAQGDTATGSYVPVAVTTSQDFQAGRDGWVEIWVDGNRAMTLKGTDGQLALAPGNHTLLARLVTLQHEPLRVPATSTEVTVTVPQLDPRGP